ncbi:hypothetical protein ACFPL5_15480 [Azospirillum rugosum]
MRLQNRDDQELHDLMMSRIVGALPGYTCEERSDPAVRAAG